MEYKDYYSILGVKRDATQDAIRKAYKKLARKYHPDVSKEPDAEERFKEVNEAHEVLKDPEKRAAYDRLGSEWRQGQEFRPPPGWDTGFEFSGGGFTDADASRFSDFFESLFGGGSPFGGFTGRSGSRAGFRMRGQDRMARIQLTAEEAYRGGTRTLRMDTAQVDPQGQMTVVPREFNVRIPPGIREGQQIRLAGQGETGIGGGAAGDLYLEVTIAPHPLYRLEGADVYLNLPITPWEAALGGKVRVPTLGGGVEVTIPKGARSGQKLRLKGRGLPGRQPGDQYVILQITVPPAESEEARRLYREMARIMPYNPRQSMGG